MPKLRAPVRTCVATALAMALAGTAADAPGATIDVPAVEDGPAARDTAAQTPDTLDRKVREIASSIRCPVCLNLSLADSPSDLARSMREEIRQRLEKGQSPSEIRQYFVDRYGEWVLMTPEPDGINLALWILPALAVVGGGFVVVRVVRKWSPPRDREEGEEPAHSR